MCSFKYAQIRLRVIAHALAVSDFFFMWTECPCSEIRACYSLDTGPLRKVPKDIEAFVRTVLA